MKLHEIYKRVSNKILASDLADIEQPLTIKNVEVSGDDKKTVWLDFENLSLRHKCSKTDVFGLARKFGTSETDDFVGQTIELQENGNNKVSVVLPKPKKKWNQ